MATTTAVPVLVSSSGRTEIAPPAPATEIAAPNEAVSVSSEAAATAASPAFAVPAPAREGGPLESTGVVRAPQGASAVIDRLWLEDGLLGSDEALVAVLSLGALGPFQHLLGSLPGAEGPVGVGEHAAIGGREG